MAAIRYVRKDSPNPTPPYTNWNTAARVIQHAVDASRWGDLVLVTNGIYSVGGRAVYGNMTNRVVITKPITVKSVNGPGVTWIVGNGVGNGRTNNGSGAVRCAYVGTNATLSGFTLTNGHTLTFSQQYSPKELNGGGAWCEPNSVVSNCVITGNSAYDFGGGVYQGLIQNSTLTRNRARDGGGAARARLNNSAINDNVALDRGGGSYDSTLNNCTLVHNQAASGGGASRGTLNNCIVFYNNAFYGENYERSELSYCCTRPMAPGAGNFTAEPMLASTTRLSPSSPCVRRGSFALSTGVDVDGQAWLNPPSVGADQFVWGNFTGPLAVTIAATYTNVAMGFAVEFAGHVRGRVRDSVWTFGDGTVVSNKPSVSHVWNVPGDYLVRLTAYNAYHPTGVATSIRIRVQQKPVYYVNLNNPTPAAPYSSWAKAARTIQQAIDASTLPGSLVLVSNGVYGIGGRAVHGAGTNRVVINKPITVRSVNGPAVTTIVGAKASNGNDNGDDAIRCVYVGANAVLRGFTLTNGHTRIYWHEWNEAIGGGALCEVGGKLDNCIITGNTALFGGGASFGVLSNCILSNNRAVRGGGVYQSSLSGCTLTRNSAGADGGGASFSALNNCALTGNSAREGGGSSSSTLFNCTVSTNVASYGGGAYFGTLNNCAVTANSAMEGGGSYESTLYKCNVAGNTATNNGGGAYWSTLSYCAVSGNSAGAAGGGSYSGSLTNCTLSGNSAPEGGGSNFDTLNNTTVIANSGVNGGGVAWSTLKNCTVTGNSAESGGGIWTGVLANCVVYGNVAAKGSNYTYGSFSYSCAAPLPPGTGNISQDPVMASLSHLSALSPCIGAGSSSDARGVDIDGEGWLTPPCMGADQYVGNRATGVVSMTISAAYTNVAAGFAVEFTAENRGRIRGSVWDFGDGTRVTNRPIVRHAWTVPGEYSVRLTGYNQSYPNGVSTTVRVRVQTPPKFYVNASNPTPVSPYSSWSTAARNIQHAIDKATVPGSIVLVTNGIYRTGGKAVHGTMTNRVVINKPITVRSVNGPQLTSILGAGVGVGNTNGNGAIRCVYVSANAVLDGFTLTNGHTRVDGDPGREQSGGGVWCELTGTVSNCVLTSNSAVTGGGSWGGVLNNCFFTNNSASHGGGAGGGTLNHCTFVSNSASGYGGGAFEATLRNCIMTNNSARYGGGTSGGTLAGCNVIGNSAYAGGGSHGSKLTNCTLTNNSALEGGGAHSSALSYCTVTGNVADHGGGVHNGVLDNCTLTGNSVTGLGGGSAHASLKNCTLRNNSAGDGGGAFGGTLDNCTLSGNSAVEKGGGSHGGTLNNCTLVHNSASFEGGGCFAGVLANCIVYYNTAPTGSNYSVASTFVYSCTTPLPQGLGNISADPLMASVTHLSALSPCIGAGNSSYARGVDIDGEAWANPPCIGADEFFGTNATATLSMTISATYTNVAVGVAVVFTGDNEGRIISSVWDLGDGTFLTNRASVSHAWTVPGDYLVRLTGYSPGNPDGVSDSIWVRVISQPVYYVNADNPTPAKPYETWETSARVIQDAIETAVPGGVIIVTNGIYASGGKVIHGILTNRIAIDKPITVRSVNGPEVTLIVGADENGHGDGAVRAAYVGANAFLEGFTLTNGHTRVIAHLVEQTGGGAWCELSGIISNCVLTSNSAVFGGASYRGILNGCRFEGNSAVRYGGGSFRSELNLCTLRDNSATFGGASADSRLTDCIVAGNFASSGGGVYDCTLNGCTLTNNSASAEGGGSSSSALINCVLDANSARKGGGSYGGFLVDCSLINNFADFGAGCHVGKLRNCTLTGNSARYSGGASDGALLINCTLVGNMAHQGGGAYGGMLTNCVVYYNTATTDSNYIYSSLSYSCSAPLPSGPGNIAADPAFVNWPEGDLRLLPESPCIDAGTNSIVEAGWLDKDGNPRIVGAQVDMGAFEFQGELSTFLALAKPHANMGDPGHHAPLFQWYLNGSVLKPSSMDHAISTASAVAKRNVQVIVEAEPDRVYWLESCTNLDFGGWQVVSGITNFSGRTNLVDSSDIGSQRFYRLGTRLGP